MISNHTITKILYMTVISSKHNYKSKFLYTSLQSIYFAFNTFPGQLIHMIIVGPLDSLRGMNSLDQLILD